MSSLLEILLLVQETTFTRLISHHCLTLSFKPITFQCHQYLLVTNCEQFL